MFRFFSLAFYISTIILFVSIATFERIGFTLTFLSIILYVLLLIAYPVCYLLASSKSFRTYYETTLLGKYFSKSDSKKIISVLLFLFFIGTAGLAFGIASYVSYHWIDPRLNPQLSALFNKKQSASAPTASILPTPTPIQETPPSSKRPTSGKHVYNEYLFEENSHDAPSYFKDLTPLPINPSAIQDPLAELKRFGTHTDVFTKIEPKEKNGETAEIFISRTHDRFVATSAFLKKAAKKSLSLQVETLYNGDAFYLYDYTDLEFRELDLDTCGIYSFLPDLSVSFLSCLLYEDYDHSEGEVLIIGFRMFKNTAGSYQKRIVFQEKFSITLDRIVSAKELWPTMLSITPNKLYFITPGTVYVLEKDGFLFRNTKSIPISTTYPPSFEFSAKSEVVHPFYDFYNNHRSKDKKLIWFNGGLIDTRRDVFYPTKTSCYKETGKSTNPDSQFNNVTVDAFTDGPYKTLSPIKWDIANRSVTFEQSFCSGGSCANEGTIKLFVNGSQTDCAITVKYDYLEEYD